MNVRNLDLTKLVVGAKVAITKTNDTRVAGKITAVRDATKAQGLRYVVNKFAGGVATVEAVDIAAFIVL